MFARIAAFELRYQLRNPVFWVAVVAFFLLPFGATTVDQIQIGSGGNVHKNAPFAIARIVLIMSLFYMFVSTAFVANVVVRDDETGFGPIVRATRITRTGYLLGRYAGAVIAAAIGFLAVPLGIFVGSLMPWVDPETLGPNHLSYYAVPYLVLGLPDLLLTSAIFFTAASLTRSMMASYLAVIVFLIAYTVAMVALGRSPEWDELRGFVEPLGLGAFGLATRYWTAAERNTLLAPIDGMLLWNRLIWLSVAAAVLGLAVATFRFGTRAPRRPGRRARAAAAREAPAAAQAPAADLSAPLPVPAFDGATARAQLVARTRLEMAQVFRSPAFLVLMALGLFNAVSALIDLGKFFGTPVWPVTRIVIRQLQGSFGIIPVIIAVYYGGELVWRERDRRTHEIVDASAIPDWAFVVPKALAVTLVLVATLLISVVGGIVMQLFHGYTDIEPGKYLLWYVLPSGIDMVLIAVLSVFVQALSPNKYVGWGIMVLWLVSTLVFGSVGLGDYLYNYGGHPDLAMSDMNGLGRFWVGVYSFFAYWTAFALLLLVLSHVLWRRGTETRLMPRLRRLPARLRGGAGAIAAVALVAFVGLGVWNFVNTHVWNEYRTDIDDDRFSADYEKALLAYERVPQPAVDAVRLTVELWPHRPRLTATGTLDIVNRQAAPLREMHLRLQDHDTRIVAIDVPGATLVRDYPRFAYRIYRFATPLAPGAHVQVRFVTERGQRGFRQRHNDIRLVDNGTFLSNRELVPQVGMSRDGLLSDRSQRRKYGLVAELRPPKLEDLAATRANVFHADWLSASDITVVTDADQTPIAPGDKVSDTTVNGRRTARFVITAPINNFFSIQSARYAERHRMHRGVDLVAYYDPQHARNVDRMLAAFGHGLDLYQPAFGPYQFHQARVVEFPDYQQFAQAFAGTMPYSEGIGFIADLSDPDKIDYVTYIVAHELGHQWWGHQEIAADMQGATMLIESLAQYSALMTMEHLYGRDQIRRFLKFELDSYLRARGGEVIEELPLARVENQQYIHYRKGSVAFYRLKDVLGKARVDAALDRFLGRFKFRYAPYPRSLDLIAELRKGAGAQENALITDLFERITVYDVKTTSAKVTRRPDGRWQTVLTVEAHKYYADGRGQETEAPLDEPLDFGAFTAMPGVGSFAAKNVLVMQRGTVRSGIQTVTLITAARPGYAGADPYNTLIDRNSDDNVTVAGG